MAQELEVEEEGAGAVMRARARRGLCQRRSGLFEVELRGCGVWSVVCSLSKYNAAIQASSPSCDMAPSQTLPIVRRLDTKTYLGQCQLLHN